MKRYKDLNLMAIRDQFDLDFAHYTYLRGMCSCCYGPPDLPKKYWKNGIIKDSHFTYLLFKNASNGSGCVTRNDIIGPCVYIQWRFPIDYLHDICQALLNQLDENYIVWIPNDDTECIVITTLQDDESNHRMQSKHRIALKFGDK